MNDPQNEQKRQAMPAPDDFQHDAEAWMKIHAEELVAEQHLEQTRAAQAETQLVLIEVRTRLAVAAQSLQRFLDNGDNHERAAMVDGGVLYVSVECDPRVLPLREPQS